MQWGISTRYIPKWSSIIAKQLNNGHDINIVHGEGEPGDEASQSYTEIILPQSELRKCEDEEKRRELEKEIREYDEVMNIWLPT